jgi:hypothetical protein
VPDAKPYATPYTPILPTPPNSTISLYTTQYILTPPIPLPYTLHFSYTLYRNDACHLDIEYNNEPVEPTLSRKLEEGKVTPPYGVPIFDEVCVCVYMRMCVYVCVYGCMCICMCMCVYVYAYLDV